METLVIGVGNEYRGDDAVGILIARQLMERNLPNITVLEQSGEGTDLMTTWDGAETVFVIDAAQSESPPGTIHRFEAHNEQLPADTFSFSSHAFGVVEAIEMSRVLGTLPERVVVYGIEGCNFESGLAISSEVRQAVDNLIRQVLQEIQEL